MSKTKDLDLLLQGFVDRGLPGCGLQVMQGGKKLYEGYFGYADIEAKKPVTDKSVFRLASMSKIPMYTVMMILYERGKFLLNDPISNWLPEWANMKKFVRQPNGYVTIEDAQKPILIRDVLSMKCGLPYCNTMEPSNDRTLTSMQKCMKPLIEKGHYTNREHVRAMSGAILACEPGDEWIYGFSSELAVAVIEAVCDKSVDDVMQELLFDPLEMADTRSRFYGDIEERMVKLYGKGENGSLTELHLPFDDKHKPGPENEAGWARLYSTVSDYSKLMAMLANGGTYEGRRVMGRKTIDMMRANGLAKPFDDLYNAGYGFGFGVRTLVDKAMANHNGSVGAFGWTGGFGTWAEADPDEKVSIVYMHNQMPNEEEYYHLRMRTAAYGLVE